LIIPFRSFVILAKAGIQTCPCENREPKSLDSCIRRNDKETGHFDGSLGYKIFYAEDLPCFLGGGYLASKTLD